MKAYLVMVTENCTTFRGKEVTRVYRAFADKQKANDCVKNITIKDICVDPDLRMPWPDDYITITYDYCSNLEDLEEALDEINDDMRNGTFGNYSNDDDFYEVLHEYEHCLDDNHGLSEHDIHFEVTDFDQEFWCHCEIEEVEIQ